MDVMEAGKARRSICRYRDDPVPDAAIDTILEAALGQKSVEQAPVVIVGCVDFASMTDRGKRTRELLRARAVRLNLALLPLGYPGEEPAMRPRKTLEEILL